MLIVNKSIYFENKNKVLEQLYLLICVIIVIADALDPSIVAGCLNLDRMKKRKWNIQGACAKTGTGLFESMKAMSELIKSYKNESLLEENTNQCK